MLLRRLRTWLRPRRRRQRSASDARPRITFFGGKGGVGKTTCAAAWALGMAARGRSTLLVSTDPAHSLGDVLGRTLGSGATPIANDLMAMELDPETALADYLAEVRHNLESLASPELRTLAIRQAELAALAPGATESALFDAIVRCILDAGDTVDELVFDTAPTGHTLQLLALPEVMADWTEAMLARRHEARAAWLQRAPSDDAPEDRAAAILDARRRRFTRVRDLLGNAERTRFVPVLNPDALSLEETRRMIRALEQRGIHVPLLIVNRLLPRSETGAFLASWRATQDHYLNAIDRVFADRPRLRIGQTAHEIRGLEALRALELPPDSVP